MGRKALQVQPIDPDFHGRLMSACKLAGLSDYRALAKKLKVSRQIANKWWRGQTDPRYIRAVDLFKIARGLHVSKTWLLTGEGDMTPGQKMRPDHSYVLAIYEEFGQENKGWRDDWISEGAKRLERLGLKPSVSRPFPLPQS